MNQGRSQAPCCCVETTVAWKQQLRGNNRALALANMALDFGTGWRIMVGVEGNGVDMAAAR